MPCVQNMPCRALALLINHNDTAGIRNALETGAEWGKASLLAARLARACRLVASPHPPALGIAPVAAGAPCCYRCLFVAPPVQSGQTHRTRASCRTPPSGWWAPCGASAGGARWVDQSGPGGERSNWETGQKEAQLCAGVQGGDEQPSLLQPYATEVAAPWTLSLQELSLFLPSGPALQRSTVSLTLGACEPQIQRR